MIKRELTVYDLLTTLDDSICRDVVYATVDAVCETILYSCVAKTDSGRT